MRSLFLLILAASVSLALGCATITHQADQQTAKSQVLTSTLGKTEAAQAATPSAVVTEPGYYFGNGETVPLLSSRALPPLFNEPVSLVMPSAYLFQILDRMGRLTGLPVQVGTDLSQSQSQSTNQNTTGTQQARTGELFSLDYQGTLQGLLDTVAGHYGIAWSYRTGALHFDLYETRTFTLAALPGSIDTDTLISNQSASGTNSGTEAGGAGGSTSSSAQNVDSKSSTNEFTVVLDTIKSMLSKNGTVVADASAGTLTATDTTTVMRRVAAYIDGVNNALERQVAITVKVYSFSVNNSELHSFNLTAVFENLQKQYNINVTGITPSFSLDNAASLTTAILNTASNTQPALGQWAGTNALFNVLSQYGKVALMRSGSGFTLQGQPLPLQVTQTVGYLASTSTTSAANVGATTSLTPGQVTTGFSMIVTPRILANNKLILQYTLDLSTLDALNTITSGGQSIQVPNVSSRRFLQRVLMNSGATLVLAGFVQNDATRNQEYGLASYASQGLGTQNLIFIVLTASKV